MIGRRKFLRAISVAPLAARQAAEQSMLDLSRISVALPETSPLTVTNHVEASAAQKIAALAVPHVRAQIRAALFEECRQVSNIDPDIAVHRSFSLAAKIAYQRQRNVEQRMGDLTKTEYPWDRLDRIFSGFTGL